MKRNGPLFQSLISHTKSYHIVKKYFSCKHITLATNLAIILYIWAKRSDNSYNNSNKNPYLLEGPS